MEERVKALQEKKREMTKKCYESCGYVERGDAGRATQRPSCTVRRDRDNAQPARMMAWWRQQTAVCDRYNFIYGTQHC